MKNRYTQPAPALPSWLKNGLLLCLLLLSGCAGASGKLLDATPAALKQSASNFASALYGGEINKVLQHSGYPFYLNHEALIYTEEEWKLLLQQLLQQARPAPTRIVSLEFMTPAQVVNHNPMLWAKLLEYGFEQKIYLRLQVEIQPTGKAPFEEILLLLLDPASAQVIGFIS